VHELSICQALIEQLSQLVEQHQAKAVAVVSLSIGPLSGVEPNLLAHAFPLAAAGTKAEKAVLSIEQPAIRVRCRRCQAVSEATANRLLCAVCGPWQTELISGDELLLLRVEMEKNEVA